MPYRQWPHSQLGRSLLPEAHPTARRRLRTVHCRVMQQVSSLCLRKPGIITTRFAIRSMPIVHAVVSPELPTASCDLDLSGRRMLS